MKIVRLSEFKKYRQFKQILLDVIVYHKRSIPLREGVYSDEHLQLYSNIIHLSERLIEYIERVATKETKLQLPSLIDNDVKFVL